MLYRIGWPGLLLICLIPILAPLALSAVSASESEAPQFGLFDAACLAALVALLTIIVGRERLFPPADIHVRRFPANVAAPDWPTAAHDEDAPSEPRE